MTIKNPHQPRGGAAVWFSRRGVDAKPKRAPVTAKAAAHVELTHPRPDRGVGLVLFDLETPTAARAQGALGPGLDHRGGRNLERPSARGARFELKQLLPCPSERRAQQAGARIQRRSVRFEAAHDGTTRSGADHLSNHRTRAFKAVGAFSRVNSGPARTGVLVANERVAGPGSQFERPAYDRRIVFVTCRSSWSWVRVAVETVKLQFIRIGFRARFDPPGC